MGERPVELHHINLENVFGQPVRDRVSCLMLNRPDVANAFNGAMLDAITETLGEVAADPHCRLLFVAARGKHFSAGADLGWMKDSAALGREENLREAAKLTAMFEALAGLRMPTVAVVNGAAYGGAVGIIACCDYAIAIDSARFCLSEVRVGLIPAVILPYVSRKLTYGDLRRFTLQGRVFSAEEAKTSGLVQLITDAAHLEATLRDEANELLKASPDAQALLKKLQAHLDDHSHSQGQHTADAIAEARASASGQAGLQAFFDKKTPPWCARVPANQPLVFT